MSGLAIGIAVGLLLSGLLGLVAGLVWLGLQLRREEGRLAQEIVRLEAAINAVIAGTSGADRRAGRIEQRLLDLQRRIEDLEEAQHLIRPYDEAIRLVRQGAGAQRLVEELGLSRGEADLLLMLHGGRDGKAH